MIYVKMVDGVAVDYSEKYVAGDNWQSRWDWKSLEHVESICDQLKDKNTFLPVDRGPSTAPRYDLIVAPKVGDDVSYALNGDSYPDGQIVAITKSFKTIKTSTGKAYRRRKLSGSWQSGCWSLIPGHHSERNPHF